MSDPSTDRPAPPDSPGERRLERPPSERYREPEPAAAPSSARPGVGRTLAAGLATGLAGAVATMVLGGVLAISAGLVVVAAAAGWVIGTVVRIVGGFAVPSRTRVAIALLAAFDAFVLGQLGLWWYATLEGGVLGPVDYLAQTFGVLVPLQAVVLAALAWWSAR